MSVGYITLILKPVPVFITEVQGMMGRCKKEKGKREERGGGKRGGGKEGRKRRGN